MNRFKTLVLSIAFIATTSAFSQIEAPQPSPLAKLSQKVGLTDIEISYSRPGVKGRTIFGELEKWDALWRTGANATTKIKFSDDVKVNGMPVPAGEYTLFTIPGKEEWTVILNKNLALWGTAGYNEAENVAKFQVKSNKLTDLVETFTIDFTNSSTLP
ncbi:MAG TPA: DUF2911 domain-containing protein [Vicingus sp.]|nr:DUF2911 domain-containing protein [Vicingus sp.]